MTDRKARAAQAQDVLGINERKAKFLAALFFEPFYRASVLEGQLEEGEGLFDHYLRAGIYQNLQPGPFFDVEALAKVLKTDEVESAKAESFEPPPRVVMLEWLESFSAKKLMPSPLLDCEQYLKANPDLEAADMDPIYHFVLHGQFESRPLGNGCELLDRAISLRAKSSGTPAADVYTQFYGAATKTLSSQFWAQANKLFQPNFYAAQLEESGEPIPPKGDMLLHFVGYGAFYGLRPTLFFNEAYYLEALNARPELTGRSPVKGVSSYFHWLEVGVANRVVPTPLFDIEHYKDAHADMKKAKEWPFMHYLQFGCKEGARHPSIYFSAPYFLAQKLDNLDEVLMVSYTLHANQTEVSPAQGIAPWMFVGEARLSTDTKLELFIKHVNKKLKKLESAKMQEITARAAFLEPLVLRPYGSRQVYYAPMKHAAAELLNLVEEIRFALPHSNVDSIVLIPHCRMAGSARVAGALVTQMAMSRPNERTLLIQTERSEFEKPEWFPEGLIRFDLSEYISKLDGHKKLQVLVDVLRGLRPTRIVNVNSALGWDFLQKYGKPFSSWTDLHAYMFTWDLDIKGNKGGYPIVGFQAAFDALKTVMVDSHFLRNELIERYALPSLLQQKIQVLHTPVRESGVELQLMVASPRKARRIHRAFWCGRFDRQKRFDVVIEIARLRPEMEIWVWGKSVLGDDRLDMSTLPSNIKLQGTYQEFEELPLELFDFFLYTSEWDGLPTILMDVGVYGMPILASRAGGVSDLITEETGWPVEDILNPEAYLSAMDEMFANPEETVRRAKRLRKHTLTVCAPEKYAEGVGRLIYGERGGLQ